MEDMLLPALMFGGMLVLVLSGHHVAFSLMGLAFLFAIPDWGLAVIPAFYLRFVGVMKNYTFAAVPLFVFMGIMMERSGAADRLYEAAHLVMGGLRGGLAIATVLVCTMFAAATGTVAASVVTMGHLALPAMLKRKYSKALATGTVIAGGALGTLIPPSVMIVIYGPTANLPVGKLFFAAFMPGLLLSGLYVTYILIRCFLQPHLGPALPIEERRAVPGRRKALLALTGLFPPLFLIMAVLGTMFFGMAAPTEAAALGAFASLLLAAGYRALNWSTVKQAAERTISTSAMVIFVAIGASFFTTVFVGIGGGDMVERALLGADLPRYGVLFLMMFIVFILGMFIDWMGIVLIIVPLFTPIAAMLGFNAIWFALLIIVNLQMAYLTPPFAYCIFLLKGIAPPEVKIGDIYRGVIPFVGLQWIGLILCIVFPSIILWLPGKMIGPV